MTAKITMGNTVSVLEVDADVLKIVRRHVAMRLQ
jgi:hypothetical protein